MGRADGIELSLELYRLEFERTKNPMSLISAFVCAHEFGRTPPAWVIDHIAAVFTHYANSQGTMSLDKLFGFKRGKGQAPAIKEAHRQFRETMMMLDICTLKSFFNISTSEAAGMVAQKVCSEKPSGEMDEKEAIERADQDIAFDSTLADTYSRYSWQKKFRTDPYLSFLLSLNLGIDKFKYLQKFPRDSWPNKLNRKFK